MGEKKSNGRVWPYAIGFSIVLVFGFCVATIVVTSGAHIQESDAYMTYYQDADANANDLIKAEIAFNKKYNIAYITEGISENGSVIKYKLTTKDNQNIDNAEMTLATSRPETDEYNQIIENPSVRDGIYSFSGLSFPKVGVWNLIVKVKVGNDYRFYNIKADTRIKEVFEF